MGSVWAPTVASVPGDSAPLNVNINQCLRAISRGVEMKVGVRDGLRLKQLVRLLQIRLSGIPYGDPLNSQREEKKRVPVGSRLFRGPRAVPGRFGLVWLECLLV